MVVVVVVVVAGTVRALCVHSACIFWGAGTMRALCVHRACMVPAPKEKNGRALCAVSYTHLTLPTICSV
eukprot:3066323-Prorocentrum_lima.AAC.1